MKAKYVGVVLAAGIIGLGSFTILANNGTNEMQKASAGISGTINSEVNSALESNSRYDEIKDLIDREVQAGNISEEEGEMLLDYCEEQMNIRCNIEEVNRGSRRGC